MAHQAPRTVVGGPPRRGASVRASETRPNRSSGGFLSSLHSQFDRRSANDRAAVAAAANRLVELRERLLHTPVRPDEASRLLREVASAEEETGVSDPAVWEEVADWPVTVVSELRTAVQLYNSMEAATADLRAELQQFRTREKLERRPLDALLSAMERVQSRIFSRSVWASPALKRLHVLLVASWSESGALMHAATIAVLAAIMCRGRLFARLEPTRPTDARVLLASGIQTVPASLLQVCASFRAEVPAVSSTETEHFDAPYLVHPREGHIWPLTLLPQRWSQWLRSAMQGSSADWRAAADTAAWDWYTETLEAFHVEWPHSGAEPAPQEDGSWWPTELTEPPPSGGYPEDGSAASSSESPGISDEDDLTEEQAARLWSRTLRSLFSKGNPAPGDVTRAWRRVWDDQVDQEGIDPSRVLGATDPAAQTSPLQLAIRQGSLDAAEELLQLGALPHNTATAASAAAAATASTDGTAWHTAAAAGARALPMLELCARYTHSLPRAVLQDTLSCPNNAGWSAAEVAARVWSTGRAASALLVLLALPRSHDSTMPDRWETHEQEALKHLGMRVAKDLRATTGDASFPSEGSLLSLQQYCLQDQFADCVVCCPTSPENEDGPSSEWDRLPAHRLVLAGASPVWKVALEGNWREAEEQRVTVPFLGTNDTMRLLRFIYGEGDASALSRASVDSLLRLLTASQMLLLPALRNACVALLRPRIDPSNVVPIYRVAAGTEDTELQRLCTATLFSRLEEASEQLNGQLDDPDALVSDFLQPLLPAWIIRSGGPSWIILCQALAHLAMQQETSLPTVELHE